MKTRAPVAAFDQRVRRARRERLARVEARLRIADDRDLLEVGQVAELIDDDVLADRRRAPAPPAPAVPVVPALPVVPAAGPCRSVPSSLPAAPVVPPRACAPRDAGGSPDPAAARRAGRCPSCRCRPRSRRPRTRPPRSRRRRRRHTPRHAANKVPPRTQAKRAVRTTRWYQRQMPMYWSIHQYPSLAGRPRAERQDIVRAALKTKPQRVRLSSARRLRRRRGRRDRGRLQARPHRAPHRLPDVDRPRRRRPLHLRLPARRDKRLIHTAVKKYLASKKR